MKMRLIDIDKFHADYECQYLEIIKNRLMKNLKLSENDALIHGLDILEDLKKNKLI